MTLKNGFVRSVSVRYLSYQPLDEQIRTWPLRFPSKKRLIWRRHFSISQSCCRGKYRLISRKFLGMKFFHPSVRLTNQKPGVSVSVRQTNKIALFPFVCSFCLVSAFLFQGQTKIALILLFQWPQPDIPEATCGSVYTATSKRHGQILDRLKISGFKCSLYTEPP